MWFGQTSGAVVAVSGGVDSALVAYAAHQSLGDAALAVTADYKTLSSEELADARRVCLEIGIRQEVLEYDELGNEDFAKNGPDRCFHCRTELGARLKEVAQRHGTSMITDGTNVDDLGEYRPGIRALWDHGIRSPLAELRISKSRVRRAAKEIGLSVHDKPSNSCLASRIPWGRRVTAERLARIEVGESIVRQFTSARQVRVRDLEGSARIEVERDMVESLDGDVMERIRERLVLIGFDGVKVDPDGYSPGKVNSVDLP